MDKVDNDFEKI